MPTPTTPILYHVTLWETGEITGTYPLGLAKRYARGQGHTGEDNPMLTGYPPIAFVADDNGNCVYNPRFGKQISTGTGCLINALESDWF